jgi:hypothetical protein
MELTPYVERIHDHLLAASAAGDEQTQRTAALLSTALEPAVRLALMGALADIAAEVTLALGDRVVEIKVDGGDLRISVTVTPTIPPEDDDATFEGPAEAGIVSRVTLRLPDELKTQAERAAAERGLSLNAWLIRTVSESLRGSADERSHAGTRVRGWVQS